MTTFLYREVDDRRGEERDEGIMGRETERGSRAGQGGEVVKSYSVYLPTPGMWVNVKQVQGTPTCLDKPDHRVHLTTT